MTVTKNCKGADHMVKGVNRQIIEINDTGNRYFEKVLLFVAPGKSDLSESKLKSEAEEFLFKLSPELKKSEGLRQRVKNKARKKLLIFGCITVISVAAALLLFNIL